ncbi:MAG: glycoside hydrolase family 3 C-terminal domain-containing protein, partial [Promicromonosporaceae bacterium]|nr:glycoside hydrolase family 3 C-terminal domain-containing protein [Promicromonosporaceae bacterium]
MADTTRPAPITDTSPEALKKLAREWVAALTPEERIAFLTVDHPAIPRLGLPAYRLEAEGAHGLVIRAGQSAMTESAETTVFPAPFGLSQTWDRELMGKIGVVISDEARVFNALVLYAPTIDLERDPRWGRNEEAYGEDPYLAGQLAIPLIKGLQGSEAPYLKTAATTKHFYANNYEFERDWDNSVVPEQLKRDYYLRPFEAAFIGGGATSAMAGYNAINGIIGMLNPEMNTLVRGEWGADGYFVSDGKAFELLPEFYGPFGYLGIDDDDWRAKWELSDDGETFRGKDGQEVNVKEVYARYAKAALDAGLDAFLAYDNDVVISAINKGVELGIITDADIERALVNQFQVMLRLGLVPGFGDNPYANTPDEKLLSKDSAELVKRASNEAVVLLKNDGLLPLTGKDAEKIAVIGFVAGENQRDWYSGSPAYQVTPVDGIRAAFPTAEVSFHDGCDLVAFSRSDIGWLRVLDDGAVRYDGTEDQRSLFRAIDWGYGHAFQDVSTGKYLTTTESGELRTEAETVWSWFNRQLFFINQANVYSRSDFHAHPDGLAGIALTGTVNIDGGQFHPEVAFGEPAFPPGAARPGKNQYLKPYEPGAVEILNEILAKLTIHVVESGLERAAEVAGKTDAAVVVLGNHPLVGARECVDRMTTALPARWGELFETVAQANPEVVLTLIAGYQYAIGRQEARARAV